MGPDHGIGPSLIVLLPRHADWAAFLVPGILFYRDIKGRDQLCAVDTGTLVKAGDDVRVACFNAVLGQDLRSLRERVREAFQRQRPPRAHP